MGYVEIDKYVAGVGTIGFIFGAYMTEIFRGAYLSIPSGQIEAAKANGMSAGVAVFKRIIWPQLVRYALPGFSNNWLVLLKITAFSIRAWFTKNNKRQAIDILVRKLRFI